MLKVPSQLSDEQKAVLATVREIHKLRAEAKQSTDDEKRDITVAHAALFRTMGRFSHSDIAAVRKAFKVGTIWQVR